MMRSTHRRRALALLPVGGAGLACVACCTLPLWIAGGLTLTGAGVALDICADLWLPALLLATTALLAAIPLTRWIRRRRRPKNNSCVCMGA
jgi:hypothetical protein